MLHAGANHLFEIGIAEAVGFDGADVFVGKVDARDAFIVSGKCDGNVELAVDGERMIFASDAEDDVVAGEIDFDHDVLRGHFPEEFVGAFFVHDVNTVADALGMGLFNGQTNVAAQAFVGHEAGSEFSGVQADMHLGIKIVEKFDHAHVQGVIGHGSVAVFGHDEIDADVAGIDGGEFKTEKRLRENNFLWKTTKHLTEEADLHLTSGCRSGCGRGDGS